MKKILFILPLVVIAVFGTSQDANAGRVKGYTRRDGTYVAAHNRKDPKPRYTKGHGKKMKTK